MTFQVMIATAAVAWSPDRTTLWIEGLPPVKSRASDAYVKEKELTTLSLRMCLQSRPILETLRSARWRGQETCATAAKRAELALGGPGAGHGRDSKAILN